MKNIVRALPIVGRLLKVISWVGTARNNVLIGGISSMIQSIKTSIYTPAGSQTKTNKQVSRNLYRQMSSFLEKLALPVLLSLVRLLIA